MADQKTFERVCDVIRETAGLDDVEMKPESTLEEIGLDSLGTVEILVAVEDEFGIQLDTEENPRRSASSPIRSRRHWRSRDAQRLLSAICSASKSPCSRAVWHDCRCLAGVRSVRGGWQASLRP